MEELRRKKCVGCNFCERRLSFFLFFCFFSLFFAIRSGEHTCGSDHGERRFFDFFSIGKARNARYLAREFRIVQFNYAINNNEQSSLTRARAKKLNETFAKNPVAHAQNL